MWKALGNFPLTLRKICPQLSVKRPAVFAASSLWEPALWVTSSQQPLLTSLGLLTQELCLPGPIDPGFHNSGFIYHLSLYDDT